MSMERRVVLLDRDGTLNVERHYLADADQLELLPGVITGLRLLQALGHDLVVLTNQSGIARGYFTFADLDRIHTRLRDLLAVEGITLAGIYACPHGPNDGCPCRKPSPGMALKAAAELGFDPVRSWVIGDKAADLALARSIGAVAILVRTGYGEETLAAGADADFVADDLAQAAEWIARQGVAS